MGYPQGRSYLHILRTPHPGFHQSKRGFEPPPPPCWVPRAGGRFEPPPPPSEVREGILTPARPAFPQGAGRFGTRPRPHLQRVRGILTTRPPPCFPTGCGGFRTTPSPCWSPFAGEGRGFEPRSHTHLRRVGMELLSLPHLAFPQGGRGKASPWDSQAG